MAKAEPETRKPNGQPEEVKAWPRSALTLFEQKFNRWTFDVPNDTTAADIEDPKRCTTFANLVSDGDAFEIWTQDRRKFWTARAVQGARGSGTGICRLKVLHEYEMPAASRTGSVMPPNHDVIYNPTLSRYFGVRLEPYAVLTGDGQPTEALAYQQLINHASLRNPR